MDEHDGIKEVKEKGWIPCFPWRNGQEKGIKIKGVVVCDERERQKL